MRFSIIIILSVLFFACNSQKEESSTETKVNYKDKAQELAKKFIILDGHVDLPYRLKSDNFDINKDQDLIIRTDKGDFDYERAVEGGLNAPFMSIYIPARYQTEGGAKELADTLINMVESIATEFPDKFAIAKTAADVEAQFEKGLISFPMGMENGAPIGEELENIQYFNERGISYITLTHSKDNLICDSSYDTTRTWNGLSPFGKEVIKEMNRVGIMVDISHVSDSTFYQVMDITKAPVIASHSSCRHFTPDFERNMSDEMIKKLGENGGVIQINFGSTFLDSAVATYTRDRRERLGKILEEKQINFRDSAAKDVIDAFNEEFPSRFATVQTVADHIDHVVALAGIDHVGLGSDYDGVGDSLPTGLKDVASFPNLIEELLKRGYTEEDIEKICYKNVFRVWKAVDDLAANG